jgi:hypothetical protein
MASLIPRELTLREVELKNQLYDQYKQNKHKFLKGHRGRAEAVMIGRAIKIAKSMVEAENKQKIKEMIKQALTKSPVEEINSAEYVQTRKPVAPVEDKEKNPEDVIMMDVPLLIRILEYAREDAKTDMDLHFAAKNLIKLSKNGTTLTMDDYDTIITSDEAKND